MRNKSPTFSVRQIRLLLIETVREWLNDGVPSLGAALAYYSVLSVGPILLIAISIAGLVFGQEAASGHIYYEIRSLVGHQGAEAIQTVIANSQNKEEGFWATAIGIVTLLVASTALFGQLQSSLNKVWNVEAKPAGILHILQKRFLSFAMVVVIGFLLLISLLVSAGLAAFGDYFANSMPVGVMVILNFMVSLGVTTLLFAMIFKILPDVHLQWKYVWVGAAITAVMFTLGKSVIGLYLGQSALSSTYGAAGSLIVVLIWIYYSTQILFFGAEFTQVYARHCGHYPAPVKDAQPAAKDAEIKTRLKG